MRAWHGIDQVSAHGLPCVRVGDRVPCSFGICSNCEVRPLGYAQVDHQRDSGIAVPSAERLQRSFGVGRPNSLTSLRRRPRSCLRAPPSWVPPLVESVSDDRDPSVRSPGRCRPEERRTQADHGRSSITENGRRTIRQTSLSMSERQLLYWAHPERCDDL